MVEKEKTVISSSVVTNKEAQKAIEILSIDGVRFFLYAEDKGRGRMISNFGIKELVGMLRIYEQYFVSQANNPQAYHTKFDEDHEGIA